jgi:enoyl-CoA hydratase
MQEIRSALEQLKDDKNAAGVILTGSGEKAFAAGADIKELAELSPVEAKKFASASQVILHLIEEYPKLIIAAVNGFALGGGCELAMACHIRIAADSAKFGQPEVNLGIIPGNGGTQRLSRLVGRGRALQLIVTGDMIDAKEAYRIGLVNKVVPAAELITECEAVIRKVAGKAPVAVSLAIQAVNQGLDMSLQQGIELEANLFGLCFATEDAREGTKAFIEKRKAEFKGL